MVDACYFTKKYKSVLRYFKGLKNLREPVKPKNQLHYGLALAKLSKPKIAVEQLKKLNVNFSNYNERLIVAEFLIEKNKLPEAKNILTENYRRI